MENYSILSEIRQHLQEFLQVGTPLAQALWHQFLLIHPADIADFCAELDTEHFQQLFLLLPKKHQLAVFENLSDVMKVKSLAFMSESERIDALNVLSADKLTDLFDLFTDEELKIYLVLLNKKVREQVLSLLKFDPESAGGIMDTEVLVLMEDFTVEKSIQVLQRLQPDRDIYQQIYIIDRNHRLVGHIRLEDLVLHQAQARIQSFMRNNQLIAYAQEDRETIAKKMVHYSLMTVPVIDENNHFLGVIPSSTLVDVLVEEASEDVQKMSALAPLKYAYFDTPFLHMLYERSYILITLLLAQSFSTTIMKSFQSTLEYGSLLYFTSMLISTGGNTSNQTSGLVIQGLLTGNLSALNVWRFLKRECFMAATLGVILGTISFVRVYFTTGATLESFIISASLVAIVFVSILLGCLIPFVLRRFNIDPAFSAGPFLATLMDILGILIYCYICKLILGS